MAIEKEVVTENLTWAVWRITEDEEYFVNALAPATIIPSNITNPRKRLEYLAVRMLVRSLMDAHQMRYEGIGKDNFGKPLLTGHSMQVSLSHSYPYVAAVINKSGPAGIDLEQPKQKLLAVAPRVLSDAELADAGRDITKHCIYWCAKETLLKIHGRKDISFATELRIEPFEMRKTGDLFGRIVANNTGSERILLQYSVYDNFVLVLNK